MESGSLKSICVSDKLAPDFHRNRIFVFVISPFPAMGLVRDGLEGAYDHLPRLIGQ